MITTLNSTPITYKASNKVPPAPPESQGLDRFQATSLDPAMAHLKAMRALAKLGPLTGPAESAIDQALASIEEARQSNAITAAESAGGAAQLQETESHLRAIKFDRHTHLVNEHGQALRGKSERALAYGGRAQASQNETEADVEALAGHLEEAIRQTPERSRARSYLTRAQRDLTSMQENSLDMTSRSLRATQAVLDERLDPYLTEVEEDAPGRDVGRFADDIRGFLNDGRSNLRAAELSSEWVGRDLDEIAASLRRAQEAL